MTDDFSKPQFFENKLRLFDTKEPKVFLLTGMSDLAYWQPDWTEKVFEKAAQTQHNQYLFLTKRPERLNIQTDLANLWFGVTVTCAAERERIEILRRNVKNVYADESIDAVFGWNGYAELAAAQKK